MDTARLASNNRRAFRFAGEIGGLVGSALTVLLVISAFWAVIALLRRVFPYRIARSDMLLLAAVSAHVGVNLLAALAGGVRLSDLPAILPVLLFLSPFLVIPRLRAAPFSLDPLFRGAAWSGLLALPMAVYEVFVLGSRAEALSGNALPFAMVCSLMATLSLLQLLSGRRADRWLGVAGFLAGFACVSLSGSRGLLPPLLLGALIFLVLFRRELRPLVTRRGLVMAVPLLLVFAVASLPLVERYGEVLAFASSGQMAPKGGESGNFSSFTDRLHLWRDAAGLMAADPWLGHGVQHRKSLIAEIGYGFTHFHNGYVTAAVDAGVAGVAALILLLAAPVITAARAGAGNPQGRARLYAALCLSATYALGGMTNLMFWHDIYDSLFLLLAIAITASIPSGPENPLILGTEAACPIRGESPPSSPAA